MQQRCDQRFRLGVACFAQVIGSLVGLFERGDRNLLEKRYALVVRKLALRLDAVREYTETNRSDR